MKLTRRDLFRATGAAGAAGAVGGSVLGGGLAAEAVTGVVTTLDRTFLRSGPDASGWRRVVRAPGEPHLVRTGLGQAAKRGRRRRRTPVLAFAQLSDVHVLDAQSPARLEGGESVSSSAYRPQEMLTAHVAEAMVRRLNRIDAAPVSGLPLAFVIQTGDNSDNGQYNEIRWNIDVLDGALVQPDSGDLTRYEGVMDGDPDYYDPYFWHPDGTPEGMAKDVPRKKHGFPVIRGLLDRCRAPFQAHGLDVPWYTAFGNHDQLAQGNFVHNDLWADRAVGDQKLTSKGVRTVTPDPARRLLSRAEVVEEHFDTIGAPVGHGFTEQNRADGTGYYTFDQGGVRFVVMDTVNEHGGQNGSLGQSQFEWLQQQLAAATDRLVIAASHHSSWTMTNATAPVDAEPRVLGDAVVEAFLAHDNVIAWVNGHTHDNLVRAHQGATPGSGFWEINTASHIDWPQQSRLVEILDNADGSLSLFCTMVDHAGQRRDPSGSYETVLRLASLSRLLAANDWQIHTESRGTRKTRNVELLVRAPAFLRG